MTALHDAIEYSALGWVKPELDETLRLAQVEIEGFVEDPADAGRMSVCADLLHQVQGTLRMVELYAPAMVAEEMEQLARALEQGQVGDRDGACSALLKGVVQLPDYLERLQSGHREISIVLMPILNELRSARGEAGLSESVLFNPDLDRALPASVPRGAEQSAGSRAAEAAPALARLREAMQGWPEQGELADAESLRTALESLLPCASEDPQRRMLWVAASVAEAMRDRALASSPSLRQAFASVEREARHLFEQGVFDTPRPDAVIEPTRQLLYFTGQGSRDHAALAKLREVFDLDALQASEEEIDHARGSVAGRNRALLDTVAAAVKEDLLRVKDALDLYLRTGQDDPASLQPQSESLQRVADTLGMLGLGLARNLVQQQRDAMQEIVDGKRAADLSALLEVAGALLYVDASLDDQVARLAAGTSTDSEEDLTAAEARKVMDVLLREAITNFANARQAFVAFVETGWNHDELANVPKLLLDVSGALRILELAQAADYLDGVRLYTEAELIRRRRVPNSRQIDTFADALESVEYYLEAVREHRARRDDILDITRASLESLGYWPLPAGGEAAAPEPAIELTPVATEAEKAAADMPVAEELPAFDATPAPAAPVEARVADPSAALAAAATTWAPAGLVPPLVPPVAPPAPAPAPEPAPEPAVEASAAMEEPEADHTEAASVIASVAAAPAAPAAPVASGPLPPLFAGFDATNNDIDDEIREIFLEEFEEEIGNLSQLIPPWKADPNNLDLLQPVRRVFHTLKGSGRLVGAKVLGEFSWKIEGMLNRVRDGQRMASPAVVAMVEHAYAALPELHAALAGAEYVTADLPAMEAAAERIAAGDDTLPSFSPRTGSAVVEAEVPVEAEPAPVVEEAVAEAAPAEAEVDVEDGIPVSVDPVLFDILQAEVGSHLGKIEAWLARAGQGPASVDETVLRAIHTMNGAFAMSEVPAITDALTPAEGYVRRLHASGRMAEGEGVNAIAELAARVRTTVTTLARPGASVPRCDALAARFAALRDDLPEPQPVSFADEAIDLDTAHVVEELSLDAMDLTEFGDLAEGVPSAAEEAPVAEGLDTLVNEETERELAKLFGTSQPGDLAAELAEASRIADEQAAAAQAALSAEVEASPLGDVPGPMVVDADAVAPSDAGDALVAAELTDADLAALGAFAPAMPELVEDTAAQIDEVAPAELGLEAMELSEVAMDEVQVEEIEAVELVASPDMAVDASEAEVQAAEDEFVALEAELLAAERAAFEAEAGAHADADAEAQAEAERLAAEQAEQAEAERLAAEQAEAERLAAEEAERLAAEQAEAERLAAEQAEAERLAAEQADTARLGAEAIALATAGALQEAHDAPEATSTAFAAPADEADPDAALDMEELDAELVDIFVEEGRDLLDHSDQLLVRLRETLHDRETIIGLQRDLHTLKGGARMAGIMAVGELGHAMESLLEAVAEQRQQLKREDVPLLEHGFDKLHRMVTRVGERRALAMPTHLIELFDARALGRSVEPVAGAATPAAPAPTPTPAAAPAPDVARPEPARTEPSVDVSRLSALAPTLAALSAPVDFTAATDDEGVRGAQEQVRVRAELLDRLVNYAGEVAIYRSRLEQQLGAFRTATSEMEQTNLRLRDQLRRLEIETEAQIIARYQREGEVRDDNFDPLELDRFSTVQQLSRALAETATDLTSLQSTLDDLTQQYETLLLQQSRVSSELQEGLMRTRMVPFDTIVPRLRRVLRQAASDTGKPVQLKLDGAQGELDRNVLERMTAPLEHMLRNAVAHGLEKPGARKSAGKAEEGSVRIAVRKEGSEVVLAVSDDGGGLDRAAIRARAEARGLVRKDAVLSNAQLDAMIFEPGFSTAEEVTRLAGRGVGMDVVASEVRQLGGTIDIHSEPGKGTTFTLRLPQTLAVTQAAFVRIGEITFAVPIASVRGVGRIQREALARGESTYRYGNEEYVLHDLGKLIGHAPAKAEGQLQMPLLLTRSGDLHVAVTVDQIIGNREIVVKPIGPQVASIPGIFGATIMGDGSVVVILDVAPLVRRKAQQEDEAPQPVVEQRAAPLVMVVDDSITMRKVTSRVLERNNLEVMTAKDGLDALERMADRVPDLMLLDIEMPRMDGYELATAMKAEPRLANVPIIMITSRTGDKHRQRALDIGVNRYLGKPYQENELMKNVFSLLEAVRPDA